MADTLWDPRGAGILVLPSGRAVRGRGLRRTMPEGPRPEAGLYLLAREPASMPWPFQWVRWPDFWLPSDPDRARRLLKEAWERSAEVRLEIGCSSGIGRTGTALACLAVLDGVPAQDAVAYVRQHFHPRAVETPWQRAFVRGYPAPSP